MVSITLSVPEDMKHEMDTFQDINWSAVARQAIKRKLILLEKFKRFTNDSSLTKEEALSLGAEVSRKAWQRHKKR
jgi:hypothetical protein